MTDAPVIASQDFVTIQHSGGSLQVPVETIVTLTDAIWGFPDRLEYALVPGARHGLWWFMSVGEPQVTFVLADPFIAVPEYQLDLGELEKSMLGIKDAADVLALVMVALPSTPTEAVTANFRAPLVVNHRTRRGMQIISRDDSHSMRQEMDLAKYPRDEEGVALV